MSQPWLKKNMASSQSPSFFPLPESNIFAPENWMVSNKNLIFQGPIFRCYVMLVGVCVTAIQLRTFGVSENSEIQTARPTKMDVFSIFQVGNLQKFQELHFSRCQAVWKSFSGVFFWLPFLPWKWKNHPKWKETHIEDMIHPFSTESWLWEEEITLPEQNDTHTHNMAAV